MIAPQHMPYSNELLKFYKDKVEQYEKDREDMLKRMEEVRLEYKRIHDTEWELRRRDEEIDSLKRALSDAQLYIFDEREHAMKLQHDNDALRIQELEDRRKIKDLLSLTRPVTQEITYFKDCRPDQVKKHIMTTKTTKKQHVPRPSTGSQEDQAIVMEDQISPITAKSKSTPPQQHNSTPTARKSPPTPSTAPTSHSAPSRVLRTVFLPNEKTDSLVLQLESMKAQMEEHAQLFHDKEQVFLNERKISKEEERVRAERDQRKIDALQTELHRVESMLTKTTKEYFILSHTNKIADRKQKEQIELLKAENANLMKQIELFQAKSKKETKLILHSAKHESEEFAKLFREQAMQRENDVLSLQDKLISNKEKYEMRIRQMDKKLCQLESKYKNLSNRRAVDLEGFNSDVTLLRKHIRKLEQRLSRTVALTIPLQTKDAADIFAKDHNSLAAQLALLKDKLLSVERDVR